MLWTNAGDSDIQNKSYIGKLTNPWTFDTASGACLVVKPKLSWEKVTMGVTEGPIVLQRNGKNTSFYSGSYVSSAYCVGVAYNTTTDLMNPDNWKKLSDPIIKASTDVKGPGHNGLFKSPDETEEWIVYHCRKAPYADNKWAWHAQKLNFDANDFPIASEPLAYGSVTILKNCSD